MIFYQNHNTMMPENIEKNMYSRQNHTTMKHQKYNNVWFFVKITLL